MYQEHYGLVRSPFEMTPDPAFLYMGDVHREGLATLVYGVRARKGFVLLTGEVGTGKTTLLHALLSQLDRDTLSAFIFNPRLEPLDFFRVLFDEYGIEKECGSKAEYLLALNHFLIERLEQNLSTLLIIDEAQNLSPEMLEEVRLLSNLETPRSKLIQIMLVGQPELGEMLGRPEMRQLRQRISLRHEACSLPPAAGDPEGGEHALRRRPPAGLRPGPPVAGRRRRSRGGSRSRLDAFQGGASDRERAGAREEANRAARSVCTQPERKRRWVRSTMLCAAPTTPSSSWWLRR